MVVVVEEVGEVEEVEEVEKVKEVKEVEEVAVKEEAAVKEVGAVGAAAAVKEAVVVVKEAVGVAEEGMAAVVVEEVEEVAVKEEAAVKEVGAVGVVEAEAVEAAEAEAMAVEAMVAEAVVEGDKQIRGHLPRCSTPKLPICTRACRQRHRCIHHTGMEQCARPREGRCSRRLPPDGELLTLTRVLRPSRRTGCENRAALKNRRRAVLDAAICTYPITTATPRHRF